MDYYSLLGVSEDASTDDIKRAFRRLAAEKHPDKELDPEKKNRLENEFKNLSEAYTVLSDPEKRRVYDMKGQGFSEFSAEGFDFGGMDDFFGSIFGRRPRTPDRPTVIFELELVDAIMGCQRKINVDAELPCSRCKGIGTHIANACSACGGSGNIRSNRGFVTIQHTCNVCAGSGGKREACKKCHGKRLSHVKMSTTIDIEPGTTDGLTKRVKVDDETTIDLRARVLEDKRFSRKGNDLITRISVPFWNVVLRDPVNVLGIDDTSYSIVLEKSPLEGTFIGIVKGAGVPYKGDLHVFGHVDLPEEELPQESARLMRAAFEAYKSSK